jgi:hypothetical protein
LLPEPTHPSVTIEALLNGATDHGWAGTVRVLSNELVTSTISLPARGVLLVSPGNAVPVIAELRANYGEGLWPRVLAGYHRLRERNMPGSVCGVALTTQAQECLEAWMLRGLGEFTVEKAPLPPGEEPGPAMLLGLPVTVTDGLQGDFVFLVSTE